MSLPPPPVHDGKLRKKNIPGVSNCWSTRATGGPWPTKVSCACWWCAHPFESVPVTLPIRYDDRRDLFFVKGIFCSWSCAKAYNWDSQKTYAPLRSELLFLLKKRTTGNMASIRVAPHWSLLKMFGGTMSVEDFRKGELNYKALPGNVYQTSHENSVMTLTSTDMPSIMPGSVYSNTPAGPGKKINFDDIATNKNEPLRLKRNKPLPGQNSNILEKILGIGGHSRSDDVK